MTSSLQPVGGPGRALTRQAARAGGFVQIPHQVAHALEGLGFGYTVPTWLAVARKLHRLQHEQARRGGIRPGDLKHRLRTDRHLKTVERHLRLLELAGFLERNSVRGCPRRGPGTRVRYWLLHALGLRPPAAFAAAAPAATPPAPPAAAQEPARPPPDPDGPRSAGEALQQLKARLSDR